MGINIAVWLAESKAQWVTKDKFVMYPFFTTIDYTALFDG